MPKAVTTPTNNEMTAIRHFFEHMAMLTAMLLATMLTTACDDTPLATRSSGAPYDVLVVGDADKNVARFLSRDMAALPQPEPSFSVTTANDISGNSPLKYWRSIVIVDINPKTHRHTSVTYEKNVYAKPQMIVSIGAPSTAAMRKEANMEAIASLLTRHEMNAAIARLQQRHNPEAEKMIRDMFGCEMKIPADMTSRKVGKDFIWLSNNSTQGMQNICIYASENRDSVMKANIKGETDDMFMHTTPHSTITTQTKGHGQMVMVKRGLWEMHGDAMGGPYVSHAITDKANGRTIVAEAFIYAPETKKRNRLRQTEAALYTLQLGTQTQKSRATMKKQQEK